MNRLVKNIVLLGLMQLSTLYAVSAQPFQMSERREQWSVGRNVTGILRDTVAISYAELYFDGEQGDFRNFSDASSMWSAGAQAQTITHHERVSMIGAFSYDHTEGKEMSGSMFISPNQYPFDLLEFTPGDKTLQSYYLMGGISSRIDDSWNVGVMAEYKTQNYAKFKDLRHYNYRMELSLVPSISYTIGRTTLGASYIFSRNSEIVKAQEVGSATSSYYAFLDKGLMNGAYETWQGTGVHLDESGIDGFPVRENFHGVALQAQWRDIYAEVEYLQGRGEVGEKLTYWYDFPSHQYSMRLGYNRECGANLHLLRLSTSLKRLSNYENVVGDSTSGGVTTTIIYGSNQIFEQQTLTLSPSSELIFGEGRGGVELGANYTQQLSRSTLMYPYVKELTMDSYQGYVGGYISRGAFDIRAKLSYSDGSLSEAEYSVDTDISAGGSPTHLEEYYNVANEYLTAQRMGGSLALRYTHSSDIYIELATRYTQAFDLSYISGVSRWGYTFKIGYNF